MKTIDDLLHYAIDLPEPEPEITITATGGGTDGDVLVYADGAGTIEWKDIKTHYSGDSYVMYTDITGAIAFDDAIKATI